MKDKITAQVLDAVTKIEKEEVTFEKRLQCLLDEYKQIYKVDNFTYEDLIKRKIYLMKSREIFNNIFVTLILSGFVTYLINIISVISADNINIGAINIGAININIDTILEIWISFINLIIFIICVGLVYFILSKILLKHNFNFERYNTYHFEIDLIDTIIKEHFQFDSVKKDILRLNNRNYKSRKRKRRTKKERES